MKTKTIAYGFYTGFTLLFSMTISFIIPLLSVLYLFHNFDVFMSSIWPFEAIRLATEELAADSLPVIFYQHFWFFVLLIPIGLICYGIFLGLLLALFKVSRRLIPYLENGTYPSETEQWRLFEFYEVYYDVFRKFQWFLSVFLESKAVHELFGAKIGQDSIVGGGLLTTPDRIVIGKNCLIGYGAILGAHVYEGDSLYLNEIKLGNNVTVGGYAIVFPGAIIGDNVIVGANTVVPKNRVIPPRTIWVHGKAIPRKDLKWDEQEYKALAEELNDE